MGSPMGYARERSMIAHRFGAVFWRWRRNGGSGCPSMARCRVLWRSVVVSASKEGWILEQNKNEQEEQVTAEVVGDEEDSNSTYVQAPKLMRIASMTRAMLDEVRQAPLDEPGRRRLVEVHERSLAEMQDVLSDDLRHELADIFTPLSSETSSESELRIAQAQLVGWLEGLFAGIQATLWSQQAAAANQLQEMRLRAIETQTKQEIPGQYL